MKKSITYGANIKDRFNFRPHGLNGICTCAGLHFQGFVGSILISAVSADQDELIDSM